MNAKDEMRWISTHLYNRSRGRPLKGAARILHTGGRRKPAMASWASQCDSNRPVPAYIRTLTLNIVLFDLAIERRAAETRAAWPLRARCRRCA